MAALDSLLFKPLIILLNFLQIPRLRVLHLLSDTVRLTLWLCTPQAENFKIGETLDFAFFTYDTRYQNLKRNSVLLLLEENLIWQLFWETVLFCYLIIRMSQFFKFYLFSLISIMNSLHFLDFNRFDIVFVLALSLSWPCLCFDTVFVLILSLFS